MDSTTNQPLVREAALKVFRGSTTSRCADIVVKRRTPTISKTAGVKTASETFYKYNLYDSDDVMISCGTTTPEKQTTKAKKEAVKPAKDKDNPVARCQHRHHRDAGHKTSYQKEKRRKSRTERNKTRGGQKQQQVDPHERTEFRKHIKRAKEISLHSQIDNGMQQTQQTSIITQGRLTRPIGIYNKGKKSDKVYRAPLFVSDRVKEVVENDLKKILSTSDRPLHNAPSFDDSLVGSAGHITPVVSMETRASQLPSVGSLPRSHSKTDGGRQKASTNEEFPKDPPLKEISHDLMDCLRSDIEMAFPGRDYFKELQEDLLKMLKRNSICHSVSSGGDTSSTLSRVDAILTAKEEEKNQPASSGSLIHPHKAPSTYIPGHSAEAEPVHGAAVYSLSQESTGLDLRQYQPYKDIHMVPTTTHTAYTADCHKRAVDSIIDTLPFLRKAEESEQTRESMTSRDQLVESGSVWQASTSNRPSESTYTWGVSKDGTVGAIEKIPTVLRDLQETSQQDWQARSYEGLTESTGGWHHALREAGLRDRLAEQYNRRPDWQTEQSNRHPDWRTGYHDIYHQQQNPQHSTRDILDVINSSHQLHPPHYRQDHSYFLDAHSQEQPNGVAYNPYHAEIPTRHHLQDEQLWLLEEQKVARGDCFDDCFDHHNFQTSESDCYSRKGRDCDPAYAVRHKSYVSPLQKPRLESPSPPKHYPQRMY
ncbi:uncharacterized protein [Asterias amurensis]|uniref:uncharacterized protein isoform X2 n=1 Tax=Asterias amurensis TaxID=7602 RepID=UPI003AB88FF8